MRKEPILPPKKYLPTALWLIDHRNQCPIITTEEELRLYLEIDGDFYSEFTLGREREDESFD